MIISNKSVQRISQIYQKQIQNNTIKKANLTSEKKDKVTLSSESKELQAINQKLYAPAEISEKAEKLKEAVASGTYKVSGEEIASSIIKHIKDQKV